MKILPKLPYNDFVKTGLAILAGVMTIVQFRDQWTKQNLSNARSSYLAFLNLSLQNPDLANPVLTPDEMDDDQYEIYFWYVNIMNQTFEEVLAVVDVNPAWEFTVKDQIAIHCLFYEGPDYQPELYSSRLQALVENVLALPGNADCLEANEGSLMENETGKDDA